MNHSQWIFVSVITLSLVVGVGAQAQEAKEVRTYNDQPVIKFSSSNSAPLVKAKDRANDKPGEVIQFSLGYDEQKLVQEGEIVRQKEQKRLSPFPVHKFNFSLNTSAYGGTFDYTGTTALTAAQKGQKFSSSVFGAEAIYQYSPSEEWLYEGYLNYYGASATKNTFTGTKSMTILDTTATSILGAARANYCWMAGTFRLCPGVEAIYDSFPVLSASNVTAGVSAEMKNATELSSGVNFYGEVPFYENFMSRLRIGITRGSGYSRSGVVVSQNSASYTNLDFDWMFCQGHSATIGYSYMTRKAVTELGNLTLKNGIISLGYIYEL